MSVEQNEQTGNVVVMEDWRLRGPGPTARYIHPMDPAYQDQLAIRNTSILTQDACVGFIDVDKYLL
jgi:hypothetical protein